MQIVQQLREPIRIGTVGGHALELDEVAQVFDSVEVDPHTFEDEQASNFADEHLDAEDTRQSLPQLGWLANLDQPIMTLLLAN